MPAAHPLKTFIIYARDDEAYKNQLLLHLRPLVASRLLSVWHDGDIRPGEDWEKAIKSELKASELVIVLVSVHALNSEFIQTEELRTALDGLASGLTRVVPVVVSPCVWRFDPVIRRLQALPLAGGEGVRPVSEWPNSHLAWASVVEQIGDMAQEIQTGREATQQAEHAEKQRLAAETEAQRQAEQRARAEAQRRAQAEAEQREKNERARREREAAAQREAEALRQKQEQEAQARAEAERQRRRTEGGPFAWWVYAGGAAVLAAVALVVWLAFFRKDEPVNVTQTAGGEQAQPQTQASQSPDPAPSDTAQKRQTISVEPPANNAQGSKPTPQPANQPQQKPPATSKLPPRSGLEMVFVPGGTFQIGCTSEQKNCFGDEKPVRSVTLSGFYIGKYEVTQADWRDIMGTNPSDFKDCAQCPVENVSWNDVQEFLKKLNAKYPGKNYRLPTEAEWEYAARGGQQSKGYQYAGSDNIGLVAWYEGNAGRKTHPVGERKANELGIHDMSGNVCEWCSDWYGAYPSGSQTNPTGPISGVNRVARGGGWYNRAASCRAAHRSNGTPTSRYDGLGFRLARSF